MPWLETPHTRTIRDVDESLSTGSQDLSDDEAEARLRQYGRNVLLDERTSRLVLIAAAIISPVVSDIKDFFFFIFIIGFNAIIGF